MKNLLLALGTLLLGTMAMAQLPSEKLPSLQHLQRINAQWVQYSDKAPKQDVSFATDNARIQLHLQLVVQALRTKKVTLSAAAAQQRARLLDTLAQYAAQSLFPINRFHKERTPYFIDHNNTHCAVGYLIKASGNAALAQQISTEHNYDYIADIQTDGLLEWAQEHGFEVAELAWIQPNYPTDEGSVSVGGGVNGEVTCLKAWEMSFGGGIVVTGNFDTVGTLPCKGVGFYSAETGTWHCLGEGVVGKTQQIGTFNNRLALYGDFKHQGENYPIAVYWQKTGWHYPERKFSQHHITTAEGSGFIAYYFPEENKSELWAKGKDSNTVNVLDIKGRVNAITSYERTYYHTQVYTTILFGGAFDAIKRPEDSIWQASYNLFYNAYLAYPYNIHPVPERVMDTIFTMKSVGRAVYLGGHCQDSAYDYRGNCLVKLLDTLFLPVLQFEHLNNGSSRYSFSQIRDIALGDHTNSRVLLAGQFSAFDGGMYYSDGLGYYYPTSEKVLPYLHVDGVVNALHSYKNIDLMFGGSFATSKRHNKAPITLNNLGHTYDEVSIEEHSSGMAIYPNPATDALTIALAKNEQIQRIRLTTSNGAVVLETLGNAQAQEQLSLQGLPPGMYIAEVSTVKGALITQKLFVN